MRKLGASNNALKQSTKVGGTVHQHARVYRSASATLKGEDQRKNHASSNTIPIQPHSTTSAARKPSTASSSSSRPSRGSNSTRSRLMKRPTSALSIPSQGNTKPKRVSIFIACIDGTKELKRLKEVRINRHLCNVRVVV